MILLLVLTSFYISSCSWFDNSANVKIVGYSNIQNDAGLFVVEVDGIKYAPDLIYTNESTIAGKRTTPPAESMRITCFTMNSKPVK